MGKIKKVAAKTKGWKTIIANSAVGVVSVLILVADAVLPVLGDANLAKLLPPSAAAWVGLSLSIMGALLRLRTTGPVGSKE